MHVLIAFAVVTILAFYPILCLLAYASIWALVPAPVLFLQAAASSVVLGLVVALVFGGIWAIVVSLAGTVP